MFFKIKGLAYTFQTSKTFKETTTNYETNEKYEIYSGNSIYKIFIWKVKIPQEFLPFFLC